MSAVSHGAAIVADMKFRMMVLLVCNLGNDINKCHGLIIIIKYVGITDRLIFFI